VGEHHDEREEIVLKVSDKWLRPFDAVRTAGMYAQEMYATVPGVPLPCFCGSHSFLTSGAHLYTTISYSS
jgi:hypothetical protein